MGNTSRITSSDCTPIYLFTLTPQETPTVGTAMSPKWLEPRNLFLILRLLTIQNLFRGCWCGIIYWHFYTIHIVLWTLVSCGIYSWDWHLLCSISVWCQSVFHPLWQCACFLAEFALKSANWAYFLMTWQFSVQHPTDKNFIVCTWTLQSAGYLF